MPRQTEIFDEDAGERLANALSEEQEKSAALSEENTQLRQGRDTGNSLNWGIPPNHILLYGSGAIFLAWCFQDRLPRTPASDYEFTFIFGAVARLVGQILFTLWCIAIWKRDGMKSLCKRCALWAVGWGAACGLIGYGNRNLPGLEFGMITVASPVNWWTSPFPLPDGQLGLCFLLLLIFADLNAECTLSRGLLARVSSFGDKLREVMS